MCLVMEGISTEVKACSVTTSEPEYTMFGTDYTSYLNIVTYTLSTYFPWNWMHAWNVCDVSGVTNMVARARYVVGKQPLAGGNLLYHASCMDMLNGWMKYHLLYHIFLGGYPAAHLHSIFTSVQGQVLKEQTCKGDNRTRWLKYNQEAFSVGHCFSVA